MATATLTNLMFDVDMTEAIPAMLAILTNGILPDGNLASNADASTLANVANFVGGVGDKASAALPLLLALLKAEHPIDSPAAFVQQFSVHALYYLGYPVGQLVPFLVDLLDRVDPDIVEAASAALGYLGPLAKETLPHLRRFASGEDPTLRESAREAIAAIMGEPSSKGC